jgi:hypothetical protein
LVENATKEVEAKILDSPERNEKMSEKRRSRITAEEAKFREMGWGTVREIFGRFAEEGDVQMCSMLSVVAPKELRVNKRRIGRFLESYIGLFCALRRFESVIDSTCQMSSLISSYTHQLRM